MDFLIINPILLVKSYLSPLSALIFSKWRTALRPGKSRFLAQSLTALIVSAGLAGEAMAGGIGNLVFKDLNRNRFFDGGDQPVPNVQVLLYLPGDTPGLEAPLASTSTDANGRYLFTGIADGSYFVFIPPTAFTVGGALINTRSAPGTRGSVSSDDDEGENGLDSVDPRTQGVRSGTITLTSGLAPLSEVPETSAGPVTETGDDSGSDNTEDGDVDLTVDFAFQEFTTRLGDFVWRDENRNGLQDPNEPGLGGILVQLFTNGDAFIASTTTESDGFYSFTGLSAGTYYLSFPTSPPGLALTTAELDPQDLLDSDANVSTGLTPLISIQLNENQSNIDAGYVVRRAEVGDFVFNDINADGVQDAGEDGIAGVAVELYTSAGVLKASTTTGETGFYSFKQVDPGNYYLKFPETTDGGLILSMANQAFDEVTDSDPDPATGLTPVFNLASGETDLDWDAGYHSPPATIKGTAWHDANANGLRDAGEPVLPGVTVELIDFGFVVDSRVTDGQGRYQFENLPAQPRAVRFPLLAGSDSQYQLTLADVGADDSIDSDASTSTGLTVEVTPQNGEQIVLDGGYRFVSLGLGNGVWIDGNGNGAFNAGEGVGGVAVHLYAAGAVPGVTAPLAMTTTGVTGTYQFTGLRPGRYFVMIPAVEFQGSAPLAGMVSRAGGGSDDGVDDTSGENGIDSPWPAGTGIRSNNVTLATGTEPRTGTGFGLTENGRSPDMDAANDGNVDLTVDFAFVKGVSIGNLVFADLNGNTDYDSNEGVDGVKVELYAADVVPGTGAPVGQVTTAGGGFYYFKGIVPGSYFVHLPAVNFQTGSVLAGHTSLEGVGLLATGDDNVDENGIDEPSPATKGISSRDFPLSIGGAPTAATGETGAGSSADDADDANGMLTVDFGLIPGLPTTFASWQQRFLPTGSNGAQQDADGDGLANAVEYVFNLPASGGTALQQPLQLTADPATGRIDAVLVLNPLTSDASAVLTWRSDLRDGAGNWTTLTGITPSNTTQPDGTVQRRWQNLEAIPGLAGGVGFVRAQVALDTNADTVADLTFHSSVMGWRDRTHANGLTTTGSAFLRPALFSGTVSSASGTDLTLTASAGGGNLLSVFPVGVPCYAEITSGTWQGHRFEVDEAGTAGAVLQLLSSSPLHTRTTVPNLSGASLVIRPHWTMAGLFPPSKFRATNNPATADQIMTYPRPAFVSYWLMEAGATDRWVRTDDDKLADAGALIIPPGEGLFMQRRSSELIVLDLGEVRPHRMARVLTAGYTLQTSGWPAAGSPASWGLSLANGFTGSTNPALADAFQVWGGDTPGNPAAFRSYFLLNAGAPWQFWAEKSDAALNNQDSSLLFPSGRAVFLQLRNTVNNSFEPSPWTP